MKLKTCTGRFCVRAMHHGTLNIENYIQSDGNNQLSGEMRIAKIHAIKPRFTTTLLTFP